MISCSRTKNNQSHRRRYSKSQWTLHSYLNPDTGKRDRKLKKNYLLAGALHVVAVKRPHWLCRKPAGMKSHDIWQWERIRPRTNSRALTPPITRWICKHVMLMVKVGPRAKTPSKLNPPIFCSILLQRQPQRLKKQKEQWNQRIECSS